MKKMKKKKRKMTIAILMSLITVVSVVAVLFILTQKPPISEETPLPKFTIDLYTQKQPFSGRGKNQSSDTFSPNEKIILYAEVKANNKSVSNFPVLFTVAGPIHHEVFRLVRTAYTNEYGIAYIKFSLPIVNNETFFGYWKASATIDTVSGIFEDTLTFLVKWPLEIVSVETIDVYTLQKRTTFQKEDILGIQIKIKSNMKSILKANVALSLTDELENPIETMDLADVYFKPNTTTTLYQNMRVPSYTYSGNATLYVVTYKRENKAILCPAKEVKITVKSYTAPSPIPKADIEISNFTISTPTIQEENRTYVNLKIRNNSEISVENITVFFFLNHTLIDTMSFDSLSPQAELYIRYSLPIKGLEAGNYTLTALVNPVMWEEKYFNNLAQGCIEILPKAPPPTEEEEKEIHLMPRELILVLIIILLILALLLTLNALYRRKNKKESIVALVKVHK